MKKCFNCEEKGTELFGYIVCETCKNKLRLFTEETTKKYYSKNPEAFTEDIKNRLEIIEKDYIKKKIKLLHIQEQIKHLSQ